MHVCCAALQNSTTPEVAAAFPVAALATVAVSVMGLPSVAVGAEAVKVVVLGFVTSIVTTVDALARFASPLYFAVSV